MLVITDEDVPDSVARFLAERGHKVRLAREYFLPSTPDSVIAAAASKERAVVVTWNRRHFKALAKKRTKRGALSYPGMSVLAFRCPHTHGLPRVRQLIDDIEAVYALRVEQRGVRMIAEVTDTVLRFED